MCVIGPNILQHVIDQFYLKPASNQSLPQNSNFQHLNGEMYSNTRMEARPPVPLARGFFSGFFQCCQPMIQPEIPSDSYQNQNPPHHPHFKYNVSGPYFNHYQPPHTPNPNPPPQIHPQNNPKNQKEKVLVNINKPEQQVPKEIKTIEPPNTIEKPNEEVKQNDNIDVNENESMWNTRIKSASKRGKQPSTYNSSTTNVGNNMIESTSSVDNFSMAASSTYNLNTRVHLQKAQLNKLTQMAYNYGFQLGLQEGKVRTQNQNLEQRKKNSNLNIVPPLQSPKPPHSYNNSREKSPLPIHNNLIRNGSYNNLRGLPPKPHNNNKDVSFKMAPQQNPYNIPKAPRPASLNRVVGQNINPFFNQYNKKY